MCARLINRLIYESLGRARGLRDCYSSWLRRAPIPYAGANFYQETFKCNFIGRNDTFYKKLNKYDQGYVTRL